MDRLTELKNAIRGSLDAEDRMREDAYKASRDLIRTCREHISANVESGGGLDEGAILAALSDFKKASKGTFAFSEDALAEAAEAIVLARSLRGEDPLLPDEIGIPPKAYVLGLCDAVGELRRCILNSLLARDFNRTLDLHTRMRQLASIPEGLVYPSGMVNLKKKQDVIRQLLDRTQGELAVTLATRGLAPPPMSDPEVTRDEDD
jgi:translin